MRLKKSYVKKISSALILAGAVALAARQGAFKPEAGRHVYFVKYVVDGDTIVLDNGEKVRYIGVDTPEIHHPKKGVEWLGREAAEFNRKLVEHKTVRLEFDVEIRDKYGRILAYVYTGDTFVNAELVKEGYAQAYTFPPNVRYTDLFLKLQREARGQRLGLWSRK